MSPTYVQRAGAWHDVTVPVVTPPSSGGLYRPMTISSPLDLPHAPTDANYVTWHWARSSGMMLDDAFKTLGTNDILVLPEDSIPYEVDSSGGFVSDARRFIEMARAQRGLVGMGPGVIVQPSASAFTAGRSTYTSGNQQKIIQCSTVGGYFGNFEMRGRDFGGIGYDALRHQQANSVWERLFMNGAHRGWRNSEPGECGALVGLGGTSQKIFNCEVDCRDPSTGARVGGSPYMFNSQATPLVQDSYFHHAVAGMPTFHQVTGGGTITRVRSEYNGSGPDPLTGHQFNFERVSGTVVLTDCTMIDDYSSTGGNNGLHLALNGDGFYNSTGGNPPAKLTVIRPTFDKGPYTAGTLSVSIWADYGGAAQIQKRSDVTATNAAGQAIPVKANNFDF